MNFFICARCRPYVERLTDAVNTDEDELQEVDDDIVGSFQLEIPDEVAEKYGDVFFTDTWGKLISKTMAQPINVRKFCRII